MFGITGIHFGLNFSGFEFGPLETVLLVVASATAMVSLVELMRLSSRERMRQRVASLRGAIVANTGSIRIARVPWYDRIGVVLAKSPLVGASEQQRLASKLAIAGIGGPGRVATFIAIRFLFAVVGATAAWLGLAAVEIQADLEALRYVALAFG